MPISPTTNVFMNKYLPFPSCYPELEDELGQPSPLSRLDVRPFSLHPRHVMFQCQAEAVTLHGQHKREHFVSRDRAIKGPG